ncbi:MAG TPA: hypothetical protein VFU80_06940 [Sphingomicrobium sp.]|nr:hypothetical protein [Sphingomicrobium sp.]
MIMKVRARHAAAIAAVSLAVLAAPALGFHRWSTYHWKKSNDGLVRPLVVTAITAAWQGYVNTAVADWNQSSVIQSAGPSAATGAIARLCRAQAGKILVCNAKYGQNGWLGIASIWLSSGHISQATTKLNDTYFNMAFYNTPSWKAAVACQEIGHNYGLGHVDEDFNTDATTSCMEYTSNPQGNEHPYAHDYQELETIYAHADSTSFGIATQGQAATRRLFSDTESVPGEGPAEWGRAIHFDAQGRPDVFAREFGDGRTKITHVLWAIGEGPEGGSHDHDEH